MRLTWLMGVVIMLSSSVLMADIDPSKPTMLITGANRGIGLEFVRQYSALGWNVIATARKPGKAEKLNALATANSSIVIEALDLMDHDAIAALAAKYQGQPIDLLLNNAAITPRYKSAFKRLKGVDFDMAERSLKVNAIGPLKMAQAFMPHLESSKQKKLVVISSKAGSFAESPKLPMMYSYRASKAALDMYMYTLSFETKKKGVVVTLLSPGLVNTTKGMKMPSAIPPAESVANMIKVIGSLTMDDNGKFLNHSDRSVVAW